MINIASEHLCHLNKAPLSIPGQPHVSTVVRWSRRGLKGITLETILVGGRRFTSVEAIGRFIAKLSDRPERLPEDQTEGHKS